MTPLGKTDPRPDAGWVGACGWALIAIVCFHCAQTFGIGWLVIPCAFGLIELSRWSSGRKVFYLSLATGFLFYAPELGFFWHIFRSAAIVLWLIASIWVAAFGLLLYLIRRRFGNGVMLASAPFIWTGLEYFRSELYYLRFAWLTLGLSFGNSPQIASGIGVYGLGFLGVAIAAGLNWIRTNSWYRVAILAGTVVVLNGVTYLIPLPPIESTQAINVAGIQLEFPSKGGVLTALNQVIKKFPETQLIMLSEYTFEEPVPDTIRNWCREHHRYLVAGGEEPLGGDNYYNMAYVVGPDGTIVHRQAKSVPIQFFKDGKPAPGQEVWQSPWGPIGILICYDLSYSRVVDNFVRHGARALLAPTMDVGEWGLHQHQLHSHVAPLRAAEYGIPIFRVCSSGISQLVTSRGTVVATAPFPGVSSIITGKLEPARNPKLPWDRFLAPVCVGFAAGMAILLLALSARRSAGPGTRSDDDPFTG